MALLAEKTNVAPPDTHITIMYSQKKNARTKFIGIPQNFQPVISPLHLNAL
jgi:hypothetical protein